MKLLVTLAAAGVISLVILVGTLSPESLEFRDFQQEYLLARAMTAGVHPYLTLPELTEIFGVPMRAIGHASPHPPPVALLVTPLALFSNRWAAVVWFTLSCLCLTASLSVLLGLKGLRIILAFLASLVWWPVLTDLASGQLTTISLLLVTLAMRELRGRREWKGGLWIGLAVATKFVGWPVVFYLLFRKRFMAAASAAGVFVAANLAALCAMGSGPFLHYYLHVGGEVSAFYRSDVYNFSIWSVGWRLFAGTNTAVATPFGLQAPPLIHAPAVAPIASAACAVTLFLLSLWAALRLKQFEASFALLICVGIVLNPVAWVFYLMMALVPFSLAPSDRVNTAALAAAPLVPFLTRYVFGSSVSFAAGLLTLAPLAAVLLVSTRLATSRQET
jgi:hypothetical protein